jgi:malate dehydrogenase (oxaloacetate-decarboxylating)(NADP+)
LSELVTEEDLAKGNLYPPLGKIKECSLKIAVKIAEYAYQNGKRISHFKEVLFYIKNFHFLGLASTYPEPKDKVKFVQSTMYDYNYDNYALPKTYPWPEMTN